MSNLQHFLARAIPKATEDLLTALNLLPEDKRNWSPMGDARTALDMVAEIAILNGSTADMIRDRAFGDMDMEGYMKEKAELAGDWPRLQKTLEENTARVIKAIEELPDSDLAAEITMPWGNMTLEQISSYPYWNTCYHEGQINYIASMLGLLK